MAVFLAILTETAGLQASSFLVYVHMVSSYSGTRVPLYIRCALEPLHGSIYTFLQLAITHVPSGQQHDQCKENVGMLTLQQLEAIRRLRSVYRSPSGCVS